MQCDQIFTGLNNRRNVVSVDRNSWLTSNCLPFSSGRLVRRDCVPPVFSEQEVSEGFNKKLFNQGYLELEELVKRLIDFKQLIYKSGLSTPVLQRKIKATFWPRDLRKDRNKCNNHAHSKRLKHGIGWDKILRNLWIETLSL